MKGKKRKIIVWFLTAAIVCVGMGVILSKAKSSMQIPVVSAMEGTVQRGDLDLSVYASGTAAGTTDYQLCQFTYDTEELVIEAAAVGAGDSVKKGDTLYTITKESMAAVQKALQSDLLSAGKELTEAEIAYEEAVSTAKAEYQTNIALGSTAETEYQDTMERYQKAVEEKKAGLKKIQKMIADYPKVIEAAKNEIKEIEKQRKKLQKQVAKAASKEEKAKADREAAKKLYETANAAYQRIELVEDYLSDYAGKEEETALVNLKNTVDSELVEKKEALQRAKASYEQKSSELEERQKKTEHLTAGLEAKKQKKQALTEEISSKKAALTEAKRNLAACQAQYLTACSDKMAGEVTAGKEYEENKNASKNAETIYKMALQEAETQLQTAKEKLSNVKEQRNRLNSLVQGRKVQADRDGVLSDISYLSGDALNANKPLAGYQDSSVMNVEVSVSQEDITAVSVGDTVPVRFSSTRDSLEGTVSKIETVTSEEHASKVTYTVTITVDNSSGALSVDDTARVSFSRGTLSDVLYIPVDAVNTEKQQSTVTVKTAEETTKEVKVSTGESNGQFIVIESGLEEGERYVVEMDSRKESRN